MARATSVYQYEQPRCPDNWNESERRFYSRLIETLDDIYSKYGRIDERMLSKGVVNKVNGAADAAMDKLEDYYSSATVGDLMANNLTAQTARIVKLTIEKMTADTVVADQITAGTIEASFAYMVSLSAKFGSFDFETVKNLVSDAMVIEKGSADKLYIKNLSVLYGQILNATIGSLCIKASDGNYYQIDVSQSANGEPIVNATLAEVSEDEVNVGQTNSGKVIMGTDIFAERLNTDTLLATEGLVNSLLAAKIDVDTLTAREAFIQKLTSSEAFIQKLTTNQMFADTLRTSHIIGGKSIEMIAGEATDAKDTADDLAKMQTWVGVEPPPAPIEAGRQWIDQGVAPWVLRTWIGADVGTDREDSDSVSGKLMSLSGKGEVQSYDGISLELQPIQAGSGTPYPPGGGKNIFSRPLTAFTTYSGATSTIQQNVSVPEWGATDAVRYHGTGGTNSVILLCGIGAKSVDGQAYAHSIYVKNNGTNPIYVSNNWLGGGVGSQTVSPGVATRVELTGIGNGTYNVQFSITTGTAGLAYDLTIWHAQIELSSTVTAYEPYSNIRPISGRTSALIARCGKNLCPMFAAQTSYGVTFAVGADGSVTVTGTAASTSLPSVYLSMLMALPAGTYTVSGAPTGSSDGHFDMLVQIKDKSDIIARSYNGSTAATFTLAQDAQVYVHLRVQNGDSGNGKVFRPQIEVGTTATDYEPYRADSYTVNFGRTIYGGHIDWQPSSKLSSEWSCVEFDGTEAWLLYRGIVYLYDNDAPAPIPDGAMAVSSHYERYTGTAYDQVQSGQFFVSLSSFSSKDGYFAFKDAHNCASIDAWKAYLAAQKAAGTPVQVAYKLQTPVTETLSVSQIAPLTGDNTLYTDVDSLTVDYSFSGWKIVNDPESYQQMQDILADRTAAIEEEQRRRGMYFGFDADGLHIHRRYDPSRGEAPPACETLTSGDSFSVLVNGKTAMKVAASYQSVDGKVIVRSVSSGIIIGG